MKILCCTRPVVRMLGIRLYSHNEPCTQSFSRPIEWVGEPSCLPRKWSCQKVKVQELSDSGSEFITSFRKTWAKTAYSLASFGPRVSPMSSTNNSRTPSKRQFLLWGPSIAPAFIFAGTWSKSSQRQTHHLVWIPLVQRQTHIIYYIYILYCCSSEFSWGAVGGHHLGGDSFPPTP